MNSILLVDSETVVATALKGTLSQFGFEVELVDSGNAAHAWLRRRQFDLILVEFDLSPHPNGRTVVEPSKSATGCWSGTGLIRELRAARITSPILVHTVPEGELYETASLDAGADDYIVKKAPVSMLLYHAFMPIFAAASVILAWPPKPNVAWRSDASRLTGRRESF